MALKFGDLAKVPPRQKVLIAGLVSVLVAVGYYYLYYGATARKMTALETKLVELSSKIKEQEVIARNLPSFRAEVAKLEAELKLLLDQLPNSAEIPSLLANITDLGRESGLDFVKFAPRPEIKKDFYAEIPVALVVTGTYKDYIVFADKVSHLPRIVNLSDITVSKAVQGSAAKRSADGQTRVSVACAATTFRFLEQPAQPVVEKGKKR
ncbi:MAG: type 4a pilus biogenesis protein PilO [Gemmatimonadota bacterium]